MDDENEDGDIAFNRVEVQEEPDMENQYENISAVKELTYEEMMIEERKDTPFDGKKNDISEQSEDAVSQVMVEAAEVGIGYGGVREIAPAVLACASHAIYDEEKLVEFLERLL